ncbi:MAG: hypothetical protein GF341_07210 [candidate division Zixibacteria bacterium]|nr:hypothetical protein [candidate division Zixibacteria bacterium]
MSHRKAIIAILMALVMVFVSIPVSIAGGPATHDRDAVKTDGGDGHPWDDGTDDQDTTPPDDEAEPQQSEVQPNPETELMMSSAVYGPFSGWMTSVLHRLWKSIETEVKRMRLADTKYKARRIQ